jgi:hypothetical protein
MRDLGINFFFCDADTHAQNRNALIIETIDIPRILQLKNNFNQSSIDNLQFKIYPLMLMLSQQTCVTYSVTYDARKLCC